MLIIFFLVKIMLIIQSLLGQFSSSHASRKIQTATSYAYLVQEILFFLFLFNGSLNSKEKFLGTIKDECQNNSSNLDYATFSVYFLYLLYLSQGSFWNHNHNFATPMQNIGFFNNTLMMQTQS